MKPSITRRRVLASLPAVATVAGCVSSGRAGSDATDDGDESTASGTSTGSPTDASTETSTATPSDDVDEWLADANGYEGSMPRYGSDDVYVWVGERSGDDSYHAFDPAAIEITPGTTVYWEWSGHGGAHNVTAVDDDFRSGEPVEANTGTVFEHTFEETGTFRYVCETHEDEGMKGAVVVSEPPSTGYPKLDDWLLGVDNWEGSITDETGADTASIAVGSETDRGSFAFDPTALKVSTGTTVTWNWTGEGGGHDVVFEDADVDRSDIYTDSGVHFEHTFEEAGVYRYFCRPHEALDMKGAIVVE